MTLRTALLPFRIQRFETTVIVGATALSVAVSALVMWLFSSGGYAQCFSGDQAVLTTLCQSPVATALSRIIRLSISIVPFFPVVAGLLAGGPIVARELETGTARLAWSLGPSRMRWFAGRAVPVLAMVVVSALAIGVTSQALMGAMNATVDFDHSFFGFRSRGLLVGMEAAMVASIALAFGALLGRLMPTLILALVLVAGLTVAIDKVERITLSDEAVLVTSEQFSWDRDLYLESRLRFADGQVLTYEEAINRHPEIFNQPGTGEQPPYEDVVLSIPGDRYLEVERREALAVAALSLGFLALGAVVVVRRRPR